MDEAVRLVEEYRSGILENIHYGHVCAVDEKGSVIFSAGDPEWTTYMRSAAKPIQALPAFLHGIPRELGLTDKEAAVMMASHRAEPYHVEALASMMLKLGISEEKLVCPQSYPLSPAFRDKLIIDGLPAKKIYHNCSGKHMGLLALCKAKGYPLEGYEHSDHPVQAEIRSMAAYLSGCPAERIQAGVDGCGLPVFAMPLRAMAVMYLKLACPDLIDRQDVREAAAQISRLMNENSDMISAPWFICSNLLMDPNIVAKGGAKGVYCFGLRNERIAFSLKVLDGSEEPWPVMIASILEQIGYSNKETIERMYALDNPAAAGNGIQSKVVSRKAVFRLQ